MMQPNRPLAHCTPQLDPAVEIAAARLAEATGAEEVILFGSRARGDHADSSDWDLCVILPDDVEWGRFTPISLWPLVSDLWNPDPCGSDRGNRTLRGAPP